MDGPIVIYNLKKTFKALGKEPMHAVKGINLKIYPGEITAILGKDTNRKIRTTFFIYIIYATNHSSTFKFSRIFHFLNVLKRSLANNKVDLMQVNFL